MQVLTDQVKAARPGVIIGGIGDEDHQQETSGHNEDDTPGVSAEDQDPDSTPEHRALDFMIGSGFTQVDGDLLVADLTQEPANQKRLIYVNWWGQQYHRRNNWVPVPYTGSNPHKDHVHASGEADQDANTTPWALPRLTTGQGQEETMLVQIKNDARVFKSDGFYFEHMTSLDALNAWQAAGNKLITVPDQTAFTALCGKPISEKPPVQIVITDDQLVVLASTVAAAILGPMADAQRASAEVLDQAAREEV